MQHVIIGNGPAGVVAAETIRKHQPDDSIVLIGDEDVPPYSRMAIPYLLIGNIEEAGTYLRKDADHFSSKNIQMVTGRVSSIDTTGKKVMLDGGQSFDFDKCLIATGSQPAAPPIPGIDADGVHPCWTMEDARNIMNLAKPDARVLQMGAGFIGCIILEALAKRGVKLTVVEMGDRMVPRMMGPGAGTMIKDWCEKEGVTVYTGTKVEALEPGTPLKAKMSNGKTEEFDLIIQATGVRPNVQFLDGSPVKIGQGVLTNDHMMSSVDGVYAAGDCAEAFDAQTGQTVVSAIQPSAVEQAYAAAMNMAGKDTALTNVTQINVLDTLGLVSTSFGQWDGVAGGEHVELSDPANFKFLRLEFKDDVLVGTNSLGMTEHVGVMRNLVEQAIPLGEWKDKLLADPTRLMEAYLASAQAQGDWQGKARGSAKS